MIRLAKIYICYQRWAIWVSGTRGPSQIHTDLTDPADGPNGSIRIGDPRTQDICKLRIQPKNRYGTDPGPPPGPLGPTGPKHN